MEGIYLNLMSVQNMCNMLHNHINTYAYKTNCPVLAYLYKTQQCIFRLLEEDFKVCTNYYPAEGESYFPYTSNNLGNTRLT